MIEQFTKHSFFLSLEISQNEQGRRETTKIMTALNRLEHIARHLMASPATENKILEPSLSPTCGIVGFVGKEGAFDFLLEGLRILENRLVSEGGSFFLFFSLFFFLFLFLFPFLFSLFSLFSFFSFLFSLFSFLSFSFLHFKGVMILLALPP